jgi:hypothetical protein
MILDFSIRPSTFYIWSSTFYTWPSTFLPSTIDPWQKPTLLFDIYSARITPKLIFSLLDVSIVEVKWPWVQGCSLLILVCYQYSSFAEKMFAFGWKAKILDSLELANIAILLGTRTSYLNHANLGTVSEFRHRIIVYEFN